MRARISLTIILLAAIVVAGCEQFERRAGEMPQSPGSIGDARQGTLQAGAGRREFAVTNPYERDASAIQAGQRLYG
jgi:hypothetical protein